MKKLKLIGSSLIAGLLLVLFFPFTSISQTWSPRYISINANSGGYYEYLPEGYYDAANAGKKWPVILFIHGIGETGSGTGAVLTNITGVGLPYLISQGYFPKSFTVGGQTHSFIVIAPQFKSWPSNADVESSLNYISANYNVDLNRMYLTGLSMGGGVVWDYASSATAASSRLAAIVPICGASSPSTGKCQTMASTNLPVLATHNADDGVVGVGSTIGYVDGINSFSPNPRAIKVIWPSGGHNAWSATYDPTNKLVGGTMNTYEWMLQYTRGAAAPPPPPSPLTISFSGVGMVSCNGGSNGRATAGTTGGTAPYSYTWNTSPAQTGATVSNLRAGSYTVTVRDAVGNQSFASVSITEPSRLTINVSPGTISSYGGTTSVTVSATGGTAGYTFSGGPTSNVTAGTYTYTVTDANGCTDVKTITISQPAPPPVAVSVSQITPVQCAGGSNGSVTVVASGGLAPYTYSWNTIPEQTTATATGLKAGVYNVTARDAAGNFVMLNATVPEPSPLVLNVTPGTISSFGGTTSVTLSASGGTAPYSYTGATTNLTAGTYTYGVTDAKGCASSKTITITQPPAAPAPSPLTVSVSSTSVSCSGGSNGSATTVANGGVAPYTYSWSSSPVQTGTTATNLRAGTYTVTVRDANSNTVTGTVTITEPSSLVLNVSAGTIDTYGGQTSVTLSANGGTAPYSYTGQTTNLNAGTYSYGVTDAKGCTDNKTITLTQPAPPPPPPPAPSTPSPLTVSVSSTSVSCSGGSNGSATTVASGGVAPYTYSWSSSPVQTGTTATNLRAGTYTVTVRDANSNTVTGTVTITEPSSLVLNVSAGTIDTYGGQTSVTLSANGGTAPYSYTGQTTNLNAGTYSYGVTDAKGCTDNKTITLTQPVAPPPPPPAAPAPSPLTVSMSSTSVSCNGGSNGSATSVASGGVAPYIYSWSSSPAQTGTTANNLRAGTYTVTVTDANNTTTTGTVTITEPSALVLNITAGTIDTYGGQTSVTLSANGGTAPYSYLGQTTNLNAGTYSYGVSDAKGCTDSKTITLTQPAAPAPPAAAVPALTATMSRIDQVTCNGGNNGSASITISGGVTPYQVTWSHDASLKATTATGLSAGTYSVEITDAQNNKVSLRFDVSAPPPVSLGIDTVSAGVNLWNVQLSASGGVAPYQFSGKTTAVGPGSYDYVVTDANGCAVSRNIQFTQAPAISGLMLDVQAGTIKCNGGTTAVQLRASGGVQPYRYIGDTSNVNAGTFSFGVVDAAGNQLTKQVTITQPDPLNLGVSAEPVKRIGGKTDVVLQASGGTAPYAYSGETQNLKAGKYQFTVTDKNLCAASASIEIKQPGIIVSNFEARPVDTAITLNWITTYENEIDYFEVERSVDNVNFTLFMKLKSSWNNAVLPRYSVVDNTPQLRRNYYRVYAVTIFGERIPIRQEDIFYENRGRVEVRNMVDMLDVTVMNPYQEELELVLMDINGRPLSRYQVKKENFTWNTKLSMKNLNSGVYVLKVSGQHVQFTKQVVKL